MKNLIDFKSILKLTESDDINDMQVIAYLYNSDQNKNEFNELHLWDEIIYKAVVNIIEKFLQTGKADQSTFSLFDIAEKRVRDRLIFREICWKFERFIPQDLKSTINFMLTAKSLSSKEHDFLIDRIKSYIKNYDDGDYSWLEPIYGRDLSHWLRGEVFEHLKTRNDDIFFEVINEYRDSGYIQKIDRAELVEEIDMRVKKKGASVYNLHLANQILQKLGIHRDDLVPRIKKRIDIKTSELANIYFDRETKLRLWKKTIKKRPEILWRSYDFFKEKFPEIIHDKVLVDLAVQNFIAHINEMAKYIGSGHSNDNSLMWAKKVAEFPFQDELRKSLPVFQNKKMVAMLLSSLLIGCEDNYIDKKFFYALYRQNNEFAPEDLFTISDTNDKIKYKQRVAKHAIMILLFKFNMSIGSYAMSRRFSQFIANGDSKFVQAVILKYMRLQATKAMSVST